MKKKEVIQRNSTERREKKNCNVDTDFRFDVRTEYTEYKVYRHCTKHFSRISAV